MYETQTYAGYHEKALRCDFLSNDLAMAAFAARFNEDTSAHAAAAAPTAAVAAADADADTFSSPGDIAVEAMLEMDAAAMERAARTYDAAPAAVECSGTALCGWDTDLIASLQRWEHEQQQLTPTS
jgi:hypothetical protein